jgi:ribonuclease P protein component
VSKKVSLKATERNLVERRFREALRKSAKGLDPNTAYIFHAKKEALEASLGNILDDIKALLHRLNTR